MSAAARPRHDRRAHRTALSPPARCDFRAGRSARAVAWRDRTRGIDLLLGLAALPADRRRGGAGARAWFARSNGSRRENRKIGELVAALDSAERRYDRIRAHARRRRRAGSGAAWRRTLPVAPPVRAHIAGRRRTLEPGPSEPRHWPLDEAGYVTRGQAEPSGAGRYPGAAHPGDRHRGADRQCSPCLRRRHGAAGGRRSRVRPVRPA